LDPPRLESMPKSIFLVAIPHPPYAKVDFERQGRLYRFMSLVGSDISGEEARLCLCLASHDYSLSPAPKLPLKRLAARSGLAAYGKNNIVYVKGMGSFHSLAAYFSDMPCDDAPWVDLRPAELCEGCALCADACPTGAIMKGRFLIDNERCLSRFNEGPGAFPDWIPICAHHCLYDCLRCQLSCPMNAEYAGAAIGPIRFDADETEMILRDCPFEDLTLELKRKSLALDLHKWPEGLARNLRVLFEARDRAIEPSFLADPQRQAEEL
jgi:epoxyqueuosine reductase